jgi:ribosome biogenesis GTPase
MTRKKRQGKREGKGRVQATREWREGTLDESAPSIVRWSRELRAPKETLRDKPVGFKSSAHRGIVSEVNRRTYEILRENGERVLCELPKSLNIRKFSQIAVGDSVEYSTDVGNYGLITAILPRKNSLSRPGPKDRKNKELVLAANIDLAILVFAITEPELNTYMLDRYLVRLNYAGITPLICINKRDLKKELPSEIHYLIEKGFDVHFISCEKGDGFEEVAQAIQGKKCVITGPSGVGKSSFIRRLLPHKEVKVSEVRETDGKGKHTTTRAHLYNTSQNPQEGAWIIDTPGLRELATWDIPPLELAHFFPGFETYQNQCQFRDCSHHGEKGCAIQEAVKTGAIPSFRYKSFLKMLHEQERDRTEDNENFR